jgi:hypothetical protein
MRNVLNRKRFSGGVESEMNYNYEKYGVGRAIEPKNVFPATAWKVDNGKELRRGEIRVRLGKILIETTSFKQLRIETRNQTEKILERVLDIVSKRGKLHNPVTETGGLLHGYIEEISPGVEIHGELRVGDEVICNSSLASIPLHIDRINSIDVNLAILDADGYAILSDQFPIEKKP